MFQLDGVSVCKLTDLHWPKPKIISMPVIDACHKTDKRYCTCSKMKLQIRNYCALVIINVQLLSKPELVSEYHQQLYLCAAEWLIPYTNRVTFFHVYKYVTVCVCAECSKRVYQGVRVKHTVKDLLAEKRSQQTSGPRYTVSPPLHLTWSIPSTETHPTLSFTMVPFTPFTLPLCFSFMNANRQFKTVGIFCAPPLYLLIGLSFLF